MSLDQLLMILGAISLFLAVLQISVTRPNRTYAWDFWVALGLLLWILADILASFHAGTGSL